MNKKNFRFIASAFASVVLLFTVYHITENKYDAFSIPTILLTFGSAIAVSSLFAILFRKMIAEICTFETSCIALGLSSIASMSYVFFGGVTWLIYDRPIAYRIVVILWFLSLAAFILMIYFYIKCRKKRPSKRGVLLDAFLALIFVVPFDSMQVYLFDIIDNWLVALKRMMIG